MAFAQWAFASAWNPAPAQGEIISGYVFTSADTAIDDFDRKISLDVYEKQIVQTYGNVGLTKNLAVIGTFDWQDVQIIRSGQETSFSKPSSISAGLQYQISRREGHATALAVSYIDGIDFPDALLTLESRDPTIEARFLWGESRTIAEKNVFAELQIAGRMTLDGAHASSHTQFTIGGHWNDRLLLLAKGRYTNIEPGTLERLAIVRQTRWDVEASVVYRLRKKDYVEFGVTQTVDGRSAVLEKGIKIGLWRKF